VYAVSVTFRFCLRAALFVSCTLVCASGTAFAQSADAKFQEGRKAFVAADYEKAAAAFDASMKLDPSVGTELNLALAEEHIKGRSLSAANHLDNVMRGLPPRDERQQIALDGLARLVPKLARLRVSVNNVSNLANATTYVDQVPIRDLIARLASALSRECT
jgi:thioredoxin-like negative regulator of GroEL